MQHILGKALLSVITAAAVSALLLVRSTAPEPAVADLASAQSDVVDTLSYLLNTHGVALSGTHSLSQTVRGNTIYNVLWDSDSYETFSYDSNYIYLPEDHSAGQGANGSYTFSDGRWMKRTMAVGDQIVVSGNSLQRFTVGMSSCTPSSGGQFPYVMTLLQHMPHDNLGGTLARQDVIVFQYDYRWGTGTDYERIYYAKGWGMVKWELYRNGQVIQTSTFNKVTSAPPTPPDLANACINAPVPFPVPSMPASLGGFVSTLYSCVLNISQPDASGFNFWLNNLQTRALTIQGAYTYFFGYEPAADSNDQFVHKIYDCILFRSPDDDGYQNSMTSLANGSVTRAQLVQAVLSSQEFTQGILLTLEKLLPD
jgi:hypothetical protein